MQLYNYLGVLQSGHTEQTLNQLPQISCGTIRLLVISIMQLYNYLGVLQSGYTE